MACRMASIIGKNVRDNRYYYARECRRVNGKPKIVWQKYLGRADDIIAVVTGKKTGDGPKPREAVVNEFGASATLYDLAQRLRIVEFIDHHVPKTSRGPSVGTYLLVAAINRCVAPRGKAKIGEWFDQTVLRRLLDIQSKQLTSQRFWDNNERCTITQRGKSKEGRASLRIVGLALLVTADFHVPLCHRTYPGNQPDAPTFGSLTAELVARHRRIAEGVERVMLIFDKGNNSRENLEKVADSPYHFIGSLVPTHHADLLKISARRFRSLAEEGFPSVTTYRTRKEIFGAWRTVVVTYNEALFVAQSRTLLRQIGKRQRRLAELQTQLRRWRSGKLRGKDKEDSPRFRSTNSTFEGGCIDLPSAGWEDPRGARPACTDPWTRPLEPSVRLIEAASASAGRPK